MENNENKIVIENKGVRIIISAIVAVACGVISNKILKGDYNIPASTIDKSIDVIKTFVDANTAIETVADVK